MKVKKVLVSQPRPAVIEKSPFYELSEKYNVEIAYKPFIRVVGVSLKEFRAQRVEILTHTAVIFTSRTTVDSFFHICEEARITVPETMKYICQTEAVALYLQKIHRLPQTQDFVRRRIVHVIHRTDNQT